MNIKDFYYGYTVLKKNKAFEEDIIKEDIYKLEQDPKVKEYNDRKKDLANLEYRYSKSEYLKDVKEACEHPMYVYEEDLVSLNTTVPCARCIVCGKLFYDLDDVDLVNLYTDRKLIAKTEDLDEYGYDLTYTDYNLSLNELRKIYYKLSILSEDNKKFNAEDYLFNHLTCLNPNIRRRSK